MTNNHRVSEIYEVGRRYTTYDHLKHTLSRVLIEFYFEIPI